VCIDRIWAERAGVLDETALGAALERHARACGATRVSRCRRVLSAG
jgi:hypothetical protein